MKNRDMEEVKRFREECPSGYSELEDGIDRLKPGRIYGAKEYRIMFDALMESGTIQEAKELAEKKGLSCRTKGPFEKVLRASVWFISRYNAYHPNEVSANLSEAIAKKLAQKADEFLREYGLEIADSNVFRHVRIKKTDGSRFQSKETVFVLDDKVIFPEEVQEKDMYPLRCMDATKRV